ncbi:MAG: putative transcriptional regulator, MerR family [Rickettsiaceae bacterium]|jgi:DNA-binding transcriptional MerR regulator|nr:putative transcriptional regulator, MerR family [Rickettsiaceae bacterium]
MMTEKSPTALKTIGEVAEDLDVATHVLRFWESKFHQIKPQKRRGRRYYRPDDVMVISQIKSLLYGQGYTIRGVQKYLATEVKMKAATNKNTVEETAAPAPAPIQAAPVVQPLNPTPAPFALQMHKMPGTYPFMPAQSPFASAPRIAPVGSQAEPQAKNFNPEELSELNQIYNGLVGLRKKIEVAA